MGVTQHGHERFHAVERGQGAPAGHVRLEIDVGVQPLQGGVKVRKPGGGRSCPARRGRQG